MTDKFIQFNDGSRDYNINSQGKIKKSSLGDNSKSQKLFSIFNKNGDDVIDSDELKSLFRGVEKFANSDGNSIFSETEAEEFLAQTYTDGGKSLKDEGISVLDLFGFMKNIINPEEKQDVKPPSDVNPSGQQHSVSSVASTQRTGNVQGTQVTPPPQISRPVATLGGVGFEKGEVIEISYDSLVENLDRASSLLNNQLASEGIVSKGVNTAKELYGSQNARSVSQAALRREGLSLYILQRAKEGNLTYAEYNELITNYLKEMCPDNLSYIKELYNSYSPDQKKEVKNLLGLSANAGRAQVQEALLDKFLERIPLEHKIQMANDLLSLSDTNFGNELEEFFSDKIRNDVIIEIRTETITTYPSPTSSISINIDTGDIRGRRVLGISNSNPNPEPKTVSRVSGTISFNYAYTTSNYTPDNKIMTYEQAFSMERGVQFNEQNIVDYEQKESQMQIILKVHNAQVAANKLLADATSYYNNIVSSSSFRGAQDVGIWDFQAAQEMHSKIYKALEAVFGEGNVNDGLKKIGINGTFNPLEPRPSTSFDLRVADALSAYMDKNFKAVSGGKTLEQWEQEVNAAYRKAYGNTNVNNVVKGYVQSQQEAIGYVRTGVQTAFMLVMIAGQLCPVSAPVAMAMEVGGMAGATFGSVGVSALENYTKPGGPTEAEKREMLNELYQSGVLTAAGMGIGKIAESAAGLVAKVITRCPKFCAFVTEVGLDATMSLLADMAITGQIDLTGEGISQLQQLIVGILKAKGVKGYTARYSSKVDVSAPPQSRNVQRRAPKQQPPETNQHVRQSAASRTDTPTEPPKSYTKPEQKITNIGEFTQKVADEKLPDGSSRFSASDQEKLCMLYEMSPELTLKVINEFDFNGYPRFDINDIYVIVKNNNNASVEYIDMLLNSKNADGTYQFSPENIATICAARKNHPEIVDKMVTATLPNGMKKYNMETIESILYASFDPQFEKMFNLIDGVDADINSVKIRGTVDGTIIDISTSKNNYRYVLDYNGNIRNQAESDLPLGDSKFGGYDKLDGTLSYREETLTHDNNTILLNSVKEIKDDNGNLLYIERYELSTDVPNKYDIIRIYPDGTRNKIGLAEITNSGNLTIEKNFVSMDGTKTNYVYVEQPDGGRLSYTKIVDSKGNVLLDNQTTWKKIDDNHFQTKENGETYDIQYHEDKVVVTRGDGEKVEISLGENSEVGNFLSRAYSRVFGKDDGVLSKDLLPLLKKLPGSAYFDIQKYGLRKIAQGIDDVGINNAHFNPSKRLISMSDEVSSEEFIFTLLHELGHYKDNALNISKNQELLQIYESEYKEFFATSSGREQGDMNYFTGQNLGNFGGIEEIVAEVNAFLYSNNTDPLIERRGQYLQEYFPKTFAKIAELLNTT